MNSRGIAAMSSYSSMAFAQSVQAPTNMAPRILSPSVTPKHHPTKLSDAQLGEVRGGQVVEFAILGALVITTAVAANAAGLFKLTNGGTTAPTIGPTEKGLFGPHTLDAPPQTKGKGHAGAFDPDNDGDTDTFIAPGGTISTEG